MRHSSRVIVGNTSARAEKRRRPGLQRGWSRKYLRTRGEEWVVAVLPRPEAEIPPHARRRAAGTLSVRRSHGNTSARAEKRLRQHRRLPATRKYLRTRGEEGYGTTFDDVSLEIPPHARRRVGHGCHELGLIGNTSARAEKRRGRPGGARRTGKYLRTRGEE